MTIGDLKKQGFDVNENILDIWRKYPEITNGSILPLLYHDSMPLDSPIVILSYNPSFNFKSVYSVLKKKTDEKLLDKLGFDSTHLYKKGDTEKYITGLFSFNPQDNKSDRYLAQCEVMKIMVELARTNRKFPFYKPFYELSTHCFGRDDRWTELDLFHWHGSNQNVVSEMVWRAEENPFWEAQATHSLKLLKCLQSARVLIVGNIGAWDSLLEFFRMNANIGIQLGEVRRDSKVSQIRCSTVCWEGKPNPIPCYAVPMLSRFKPLSEIEKQHFFNLVKRSVI